jgi:D-alanyl-D-alanine carboxypeptidase
MDESLAHSGAMGVSAAIMMPDGSLWTGVSGLSHDSVLITPEMPFDIGSVEKNLQATLALTLVRDHVISLDDPLEKWLPPSPNINGKITVRQLLNMTSGIDDIVDNANSPWRIGYDNIRFEHEWTWEEISSTLVGRPEFAPGERCAYSNTNFILLRLIIEKATGSTQASEFTKRFLITNGLDHTIVVFRTPLPDTLTIAHGWYDKHGDGMPSDISGNSLNYVASISPMLVYSTPTDMVRWIDALYHKKTILSDTLLNEMLTFDGPVEREPLMKAYGLGVVDLNLGMFNPRWEAVRVYGHLGSQFGYSTLVGYVPEYGTSIAFMFNRGADRTTNDAIVPVFNAVMDVLFRELGAKESKQADDISGMLEELEQSPNDVHLMFRIAKAYQAKREDYEAWLVYEKILTADPDDKYGYKTESLFWKATYDGVIGKKPENLIAFIAEHKDYKDIRKAYSWLAKTYQRREEMDKAVQAYRDALNTLDRDPEFYNEYAWWVYENKLTGEYANAIKYARMAVDMKPEAYYIWDTLAHLYCENGQQQEAVEASSTALRLAPEDQRSTYEEYLNKIKQGKASND